MPCSQRQDFPAFLIDTGATGATGSEESWGPRMSAHDPSGSKRPSPCPGVGHDQEKLAHQFFLRERLKEGVLLQVAPHPLPQLRHVGDGVQQPCMPQPGRKGHQPPQQQARPHTLKDPPGQASNPRGCCSGQARSTCTTGWLHTAAVPAQLRPARLLAAHLPVPGSRRTPRGGPA
jgi:hypothetical protein